MSDGTRVSAPRSAAPDSNVRRLERGLVLVWLLPLGVLSTVTLLHSLSWRMEHDTPLAHYSAFMHAQFGSRPYADLFEISFPGTLLTHLLMTRLVGYGDFGFMLLNFAWCVALGVATWHLLRPLGRSIQVAALGIFALAYLGYGREMILQRDCILILPLAFACWLLLSERLPPGLRRFAIGLALGAASTIKPQAAIGLLPLWLHDARELTVVRVLCYAAGFCIPFAVVFGWLVAADGFAGWLEMSREYLPLYLRLDFEHVAIEPGERLAYIFQHTGAFGTNLAWCFSAGVGLQLALSRTPRDTARRRLVLLLATQAVAFAIYPALSGQFWEYHYLPLIYFLSLLSALCLLPLAETASTGERLLPKLALLFCLLGAGHLPNETVSWLRGKAFPAPRDGHVDEIANFLASRLAPGDTVQPLDWTGGVVHAMLIARARLATRFMYDYHFYHHVSQPFIQELRRRFMHDFQSARPRFVAEWTDRDTEFPSGLDTTREFPQLRAVLARDYRVVRSGETYQIYERNPQ